MRTFSVLPVFVLFSSLAACASDGSSSDDSPEPGRPDAAIAPQPDGAVGQADAAPALPDANEVPPADEIEDLVVGDYVLQMRVAKVQQAPFIGAIDTVTTSIGIAGIARSGDSFLLTEQGCHVESDSGDAVITEIPDAIPRTTAPAVETVGFWKEGDSLRWSRIEVVTLVGVELEDPANEPLPTDGDDPRVVDQDDDQKPGVTVHVSGMASGEIYVVQRTRVAYEGGLRHADGRLVALAHDDSEQSVIGSDNMLLDQNIPTEPNPDPSLSTVTLVRVGEPYDCDRAVAEAGALFP